MFIFGHAVLGTHLVQQARRLPLRWLVFGALLPDLVDKPLYYGLSLVTGRRGAELGLISGTRTFGHTALFLGAWTLASLLCRAPGVAAVAWGVGSHLALDTIGDLLGSSTWLSAFDPLLFPAFGLRFPVSPFQTIRQHLLSIKNLYVASGEAAGLGLLLLKWRRSRSRMGASERPAIHSRLR